MRPFSKIPMNGREAAKTLNLERYLKFMPEKTFIDRMGEEPFGIGFATNKACQTCLFAHGKAPWRPAGLEITPDICYCLVYEPDDSNGKPHDVEFHGAPCEWYEKMD